MTVIRSVFDLSEDTILVPTTNEDRKLHIKRLHMAIAAIQKCQDKSSHGWESLWHEFYNRVLQFLEFSNFGGENFLSTAPQPRLKHEYYKNGLEEAHSVIVQQVADCSREAIEFALSQIYSDESKDDSDMSTSHVLEGLTDMDPDIFPDLSTEGFEPLATSSRPSSPASPPISVTNPEQYMFSGRDEDKETEWQDQRALPLSSHPPNVPLLQDVPVGQNSSCLTVPASSPLTHPANPASKSISFQYMEASRSVNWDLVERRISNHVKEILQKLEVQVQARIPDYVSFMHLMHEVGARVAGSCFPLLITELKALGVVHDAKDVGAKIWHAQKQISWQAALCMKEYGARRIFSMCGAGLYVQFALWDMRLMTADLGLALQESDLTGAGKPIEMSAIVPIFNAAKTDYSNLYKFWMNRIIRAAETPDLEVPALPVLAAE
ncbi:hypothetical protein EWM64_g7316 [Hericium alpestre]|uniref:Uncharacterized protein n=1 Tax=Hericium alpestre TaxID=135208 RepID=A0A4Y9ZP80_9AGAM|nr:hypothetical protein EWM64_g7316 [Hericium alpestre]